MTPNRCFSRTNHPSMKDTYTNRLDAFRPTPVLPAVGQPGALTRAERAQDLAILKLHDPVRDVEDPGVVGDEEDGAPALAG